jgi:hypothetical protein
VLTLPFRKIGFTFFANILILCLKPKTLYCPFNLHIKVLNLQGNASKENGITMIEIHAVNSSIILQIFGCLHKEANGFLASIVELKFSHVLTHNFGLT